MKRHVAKQPLQVLLAVAMPLVACLVQWMFWRAFQPYVWFLFYPAVFFSSWIGGLRGGLPATMIAAALVTFVFMPPEFSFAGKQTTSLFSVGVFLGMGVLFSVSHERLRNANRQAAEALATAGRANEQLRDANEKMTQLYEKTRELDRIKTRFFANVSHELRTPLALILGPVEKRLKAAGLGDEERRDLDVVDRNARLLYRHVSDLLDVAKLEAGRMRMQYSREDLAAATRLIASHFDALAGEKNIRYSVDASAALPAEVDREKYHRILLNILSNAFKFTPSGGAVALTLTRAGDNAVLRVQDTGPGVPQAKREAIFEPFQQVEGDADRRFGGTGLGLAIVKEFTELHGGRVEVAGTPGGGALFTVALPLTAPAGTEIHAAPTALDERLGRQALEELSPLRNEVASAAGDAAPLILVIEDNPDMNAFITDALRPRYRIAAAFDGKEGLDQALALLPDLILCDIMMPRLSGDEMLRKLRSRREMDDVPVIMLTAKADDALRVRLLREGAQDYLSKPFLVEELLARVGGIIGERRKAGQALQASEDRYQRTLDNMLEGCQIIGFDWKYVYINDAAARHGRRDPDEFTGRSILELYPGTESTELFAALRRCMEQRAAQHLENEFAYPGGETAWFELSIQPVPEGIFVLSYDITGRKRAEEELRALNADLELRVRDRTARLEAANKELESFSYSVSHDLRAPLRHLTGFAELLNKHAGSLDEKSRHYLEVITGAASQMGRLIDDLLSFSRMGRTELMNTRVDLRRIVDEALRDLQTETKGRDIRWDVKALPEVCGDPAMLKLVFVNLLSNALKFTRQRETASVEIGGEPGGDGETIVHVTDNGVGFEMKYADKLFTLFQRLHRPEEFEGTGVGLANVRRIIHRHGGKTWAKGLPGKGATVYFSLPNAMRS